MGLERLVSKITCNLSFQVLLHPAVNICVMPRSDQSRIKAQAN